MLKPQVENNMCYREAFIKEKKKKEEFSKKIEELGKLLEKNAEKFYNKV